MNVLFVCKGNVARSQIASELFNKYTGLKSGSAGIKVGKPGNIIKDEGEFAVPVIENMLKENIDISNNRRTLLTEDMAKNYDRIVILCEKSIVPEYLLNNHDAIFWEIEDPAGQEADKWKIIIERIRKLIKEFIAENNL